MKISKSDIIGEIVAQDYRTAVVFESFGIDFCCKGNRSITEACKQENIAIADLLEKLHKTAQQQAGNSIDYHAWPMDLLADYIEKKHHRYVEEKIPLIKAHLEKICAVHGEQHPELLEITALFGASAGELAKHMKKEELVLFPFVRMMVKAKLTGKPISLPHFGSVQNPVAMMEQEHDNEGERFRKIAALSNGYTPPVDACSTYKVTFSLLKEFENDLHLHIHLENNILFPKAVALEKELSLGTKTATV